MDDHTEEEMSTYLLKYFNDEGELDCENYTPCHEIHKNAEQITAMDTRTH